MIRCGNKYQQYQDKSQNKQTSSIITNSHKQATFHKKKKSNTNILPIIFLIFGLYIYTGETSRPLDVRKRDHQENIIAKPFRTG